MKIRRIGVFSLGKMLGVVYSGLGVLIGFAVAGFSLLGGAMAPDEQGSFAKAGVAAIAAIVIVPACYGITGFIAGMISAALFNLGAGMTGGLHVETGP
jgi:hypothetical protein